MKRFFLVLFFMTGNFLASVAWADLPGAYKALEPDQAFAQAGKERKKVLVVFTQIRCLPCRYVTGAMGRDDVKAAYAPNFVVAEVKLDEPDGREGFKRFGVRSTPTFVFFTHDRKRICQTSGFNNPQQGIELARAVVRAEKPLDGPERTRGCSRLNLQEHPETPDTSTQAS